MRRYKSRIIIAKQAAAECVGVVVFVSSHSIDAIVKKFALIPTIILEKDVGDEK